VVVFVSTYASVANLITSVTYGGVALTRLTGGLAQDGAGESGRLDAFFLGSGLGTGNQTITVTRTNNATVMYASAATVTAGADTAVPTNTIVLLQGDGTLTVQSVNDTSPGQNSVRYAGAYSGLNAPPAAGTGSTLLNSIDIGNYGSALVRETTAGQGARNVGFSAATDDRAVVHLAIRELVPRTETPIVGTFTLTGNAADLTVASPKVIEPVVGTFTLTGNSADTRRNVSAAGDRGQFFLPERNLVSYSEEFNNAYWDKQASSITADAAAAPDGTLTADRLIEAGGLGLHEVNVIKNLDPGKSYAISVYAKANTRTRVRVEGYTNSWDSLPQGIFDLSSGNVVSSSGSSAATIEAVGNGWYRCTVYGIPTESLSGCRYGLVQSGTTYFYSGDGASNLYIWGAQLEEGSLSDYDPTGPSIATRTDLRHNATVIGSKGTFSLTGNDATLTVKVPAVLEAATETFAFTGNPTTFRLGRNVAADRGTFLLTGNPATLSKTSSLEAERGLFTLTGGAPTLRRDFRLTAETGTFNATGQPATLRHNPSIEAATGSFALTGGDPALLRGRYLSGGAGTFIETGQPATFRRTWALGAEAGAFNLIGKPAALTELGAYEIDPIVGSFALAGQPAQLAQSQSLPVEAGTFILSEQPAALRQNQAITPDAGAFELSGNPATIRRNRNTEAAFGAFALTGNNAELQQGYRLDAAANQFLLTGNPATLSKQSAKQLGAATGAFALSGQPASLVADRLASANRGLLALTGQPANLLQGAAIGVQSGAFSLAGQSATFRISRSLPAQSVAFALTGNSIALTEAGDFQLVADSGSFVLTGLSAALAKSGGGRRRNVLIF
jgi:hypothetical protein